MDPSASLYVLEKKFIALLEFGTLYIIQNNSVSAHEGKKAEQSRLILISETKFKIKINFYAGTTLSDVNMEYCLITLTIIIADKRSKISKINNGLIQIANKQT